MRIQITFPVSKEMQLSLPKKN